MSRYFLKIIRASLAFLALVVFASGCSEGSHNHAHEESEEHGHDDNNDHNHEGENDIVKLDSIAMRRGGIETGLAENAAFATIPVTGTITYDGNHISHIGSRTDGRVVAIHADLGARISKGTRMATLESPEIGQIRAEEREAQALVEIAKENYGREQRLEQQGISSRKELLQAEAELRKAEAAWHSNEEKLRVLGAAQGHGGQFSLIAPFNGVIVTRHASLGEMVSPTDTLFTLADLSRVWIELDIFERDIPLVHAKQSVTITVPAYPDRTFPGTIVYVGDVLNEQRRTISARVEIPNPNGMLKPGMFAQAQIAVKGAQATMVVVPQRAVQTMEGQSVVFVPTGEPGTFRVTPVVVGEPLSDGRIVVRSGLEAGTAVVVSGALSLRAELAKDEIGDHGHAH